MLAHAYARLDHVLDEDLPISIPVPPIAEVQVALTAADSDITGLSSPELKQRVRTGTVVSTDDRDWELRYDELSTFFNQSRAIAVDMECATIATNGFRLRVPYGTLLCVSDKPLHGEIKLPGMANAFYAERVSQHLKICLRLSTSCAKMSATRPYTPVNCAVLMSRRFVEGKHQGVLGSQLTCTEAAARASAPV